MSDNFVFNVFSKAQTEELTQKKDYRESIRKVLKCGEEDKDEILIDFYENLLKFCISLDFTLEKISCTLGIAVFIVKNSVSSYVPVTNSLDTLKNLLKRHSIQRPPYSVKVYSNEEVKQIEDFIFENYFKNYGLYSYAFTPHKDVIITTEKLNCAAFPVSLSLMDGSEMNPESFNEFREFLPKVESIHEIKTDVKAKEDESDSQDDSDPVSNLLNNEVKAMKTLMEERMKKQDDEIFAKIEVLKK